MAMRHWISLFEEVDPFPEITFEAVLDVFRNGPDETLKKSWVNQFNVKRSAFDDTHPFLDFVRKQIVKMKGLLVPYRAAPKITLYRGLHDEPEFDRPLGVHWTPIPDGTIRNFPWHITATAKPKAVDWLMTISHGVLFWDMEAEINLTPGATVRVVSIVNAEEFDFDPEASPPEMINKDAIV